MPGFPGAAAGAFAPTIGLVDPAWHWAWRRLTFALPMGLGTLGNYAPNSLAGVTWIPGLDSTVPTKDNPIGPGFQFFPESGPISEGADSSDAYWHSVADPTFFATAWAFHWGSRLGTNDGGGFREMSMFVAMEPTARDSQSNHPGLIGTGCPFSGGGVQGIWEIGTTTGNFPYLAWGGAGGGSNIKNVILSGGGAFWSDDGLYHTMLARIYSEGGSFRFQVKRDVDVDHGSAIVSPGPNNPALGRSSIYLSRNVSEILIPAVYGMHGRWIAAYVWNRQVTDEEYEALHADPLGPFRLRRRRVSGVAPPAADDCHWFTRPPGQAFFGPAAGASFYQMASGDWFEEKVC